MQQNAGKALRGQFFKNIEEQQLSELTFSFLRSSNMSCEIEGYITTCQDEFFNTLVYRQVMEMQLSSSHCRAYMAHLETMMHLFSACLKYASYMYINKHDMAVKVMYFHSTLMK